MDRIITFKSKPFSLAGRRIKAGALAPDFSVTDAGLKQARLSDFKDSIKIITSFLSLDTRVCDMQVKEFNRRAQNVPGNVVIIGISQDLPFAQKRFCDSNKIDRVMTFSDYKTNSFGINYGLLIKELHLLARAVIIIDMNNIVRYMQIVEEATNAPDYEAALGALEVVVRDPGSPGNSALSPRCLPCEAGTPPLARNRIEELLAGLKGWELIEGKKIKKSFKFKDFIEAKYFVDLVSVIAREQNHHPNISIIYNTVITTLSTHAIGGLSDNDFIMAGIIEDLNG